MKQEMGLTRQVRTHLHEIQRQLVILAKAGIHVCGTDTSSVGKARPHIRRSACSKKDWQKLPIFQSAMFVDASSTAYDCRASRFFRGRPPFLPFSRDARALTGLVERPPNRASSRIRSLRGIDAMSKPGTLRSMSSAKRPARYARAARAQRVSETRPPGAQWASV